ncbi:glycosyltransferase family 4 protein [Streptomyces montanisoli]|uniref:Glycosyltransferase family 4 protein n=1 Tax=Streptomyces montanisoli TaxID=2798581 RepID=A0A940RY88_9ACTN|nr:glycosyltransferase family 4 protein [Streptomyces montanisoli]MBP0461121.1 glycosyltransferase family 4 protein [Streptomyces montanisoli]
MTPLRSVQVLGGGSAGSSAHVRSLASGLVARGVRVTVCAPEEVERTYDFRACGALHLHVPRRGDPVSIAALRAACAGADVVHANGLHAASRAALALGGRPVPLVVTWHTRAAAYESARGGVTRLFERSALRAASVVFATSSDLVDTARARGARDVRLAPLAVPAPRVPGATGPDSKARAELGAVERPLAMAVGSLVPEHGHALLLDAVALWRGQDIDPLPLVVIAGEGRERPALQRRIIDEDLPVLLLGSRDDVTELLAAADVAVVSSRWESRSLLAQEALRLGVPLVATAVGGVPELVGRAAELVPYGDPLALSAALLRLLTDPGRRAELAAEGQAQAAAWPTEDETVAQVLSVYDEVTGARGNP